LLLPNSCLGLLGKKALFCSSNPHISPEAILKVDSGRENAILLINGLRLIERMLENTFTKFTAQKLGKLT
jgi:hypothetical protein